MDLVSEVITATTIGLQAYKISVEVDLVRSIPGMSIVGLPDTAVSEARERVKSAVKNSNFEFPNKKIVVNLAPADIKKEGTNYDLPIAVGILSACNEISSQELLEYAFIGELSLDGSLRAINGVLPIAAELSKLGIKKLIVPAQNAQEASLADNIEVYSANSLSEVAAHFSLEEETKKLLPIVKVDTRQFLDRFNSNFIYDFKDVKGQEKAKKALEIAAAGGHNILMSGPPGSGKTLLSKCFASILPPLTFEEAIEITKIYSISGLLHSDLPIITERPFRKVHHSASAIGIIGGGTNPKPGEITLAHRGVLFLDEIVEFPRNVLEVLRQPLEDGEVVISRAANSIKYPAKFTLLASMNPCPCGYLGDSEKQCICSEFQIKRYRSRLSGPLLDRIDIQIDIPRLKSEDLLNIKQASETSFNIRKRVVSARNIQLNRYKNLGIYTNSELSPDLIKIYCKLDDRSIEMMKIAIKKFNLSGRAYDRILKLSRTIADLDSSENIQASHLAQALQYRSFIEHE